MINVRGKELDFNFMNADHVQKWEDSRKTVQKRYSDIAKVTPEEVGLQEYADLLRKACASIFDLFDGIFGEGTSNELFGSECDFEACVDAFAEFEDGVAAQATAFDKKVTSRIKPFGKKGK